MKFGEIFYIYSTFIFCLIDLYYTFYNFEQLFIYEMSILLF